MGELSYVTEQSNQLLENQLQSINSSIDTNNIINKGKIRIVRIPFEV